MFKRGVFWLMVLHLSGVAGVAGAAEYEYEGPNPPRYVSPRAGDARPHMALVLGSGGRRGFAHAGVLRVLEAEGIKPDLIVGVSIGSIIGAIYAAGVSAADVEQLAMTLDLGDLRDLSWVHWGQVRGQKLENFVNARVGHRTLEALGMRFAAVATRQNEGVLQIFNSGDTGAAVRASSAVPGRFYAVRVAGVTYVDGDVASPVPARAARTLGAEVVIAIDISARLENVPKRAPEEWVQLDRERRKRIDAELASADVMIHPDLGYRAGTSEEYRKRVIAAAADATRAALPRIRAAMASGAAKRTTGAAGAASSTPSTVAPAAR